ncbi:Hexokinase, partial [Ostertagia ostertagi]
RAWDHKRRHQHEDKEKKSIKKDIKKVAGKARLGEHEFISLESVMAEFKLSNNTLRRMMSHMSDNMDRGLESGLQKSTIAMLPSFVPELPDGTGSSALIIHLTPIRHEFRVMQNSNFQLFDYIAKALADFLIEKDLADENLPVGFTFSYPCDQTGLRSATLLRWTKGVTATGVVGKDVVKLLEDAIERDG